jgi:hypothetical protein
MSEEFSTLGFIKAIPGMMRKVWPGLWPLVIVITLCLYFDSPTRLDVLSFSDWLTLHIVIVIGMLSTTIWIYNTFKRPAANMAIIGLWFLATATCMLFDLILKYG